MTPKKLSKKSPVAEKWVVNAVKTPTPPPELLARDLGKGETSVLTYALANAEWVVVLDDAAARRCARSFSLTMIGTLSVVILAKQHGLIESAAQVLRTLRGANFRLDDRVIREALARTVGEEWTSHDG
jgi:predicted nucleic acid-binding protein